MADLRSIMNVDDEEPPSGTNKRDGTSRSPGAARGRQVPVPEPTNPDGRKDRPLPTTTSRRRGHSSRQPRSSSSNAATTVSASSSSGRSAAARRRLSNASSNEDMDRGGYGSRQGHASGSGSLAPTSPSRPIGSPSGGDIPVRFTPITGRVSRAKKGVPVHTCDICRPPKTFTRAEHLRRHQLSHGNPGYPCTYPGCDRTFHRPDLLSRHAIKHEQGDDTASSRGPGEDSRRPSAASQGEAVIASEYGSAARTTSSGISTTTTSYMTANSSNHHAYQNIGSQATTDETSMLQPQAPGHPESYPSTTGGQHQNHGSGFSNEVSMINNEVPNLGPSATTGSTGYGGQEFDPSRTSYLFPLDVVTQRLQEQLPNLTIPDSEPPGLLAPHDTSELESSESAFSTPSDVSHRRGLLRQSFGSSGAADWTGQNLMPAYPPPTSHSGDSTGLDIAATVPPYFTNPFASSPPSTSFGGTIDVPMSYGDEPALLGQPIYPAYPYTPALNLTHPTVTLPGQLTGSLVGPVATPHADMVNVMSRNKDSSLLSLEQAMFLTSMGLTQEVRSALPEFVEVYWQKFDIIFPLVHRITFEAGSNEVLKSAMAAVATQFLDDKGKRNKGNDLHKFAWHEAPRAASWDTPTKQAILLCEFYARFRGLKTSIGASQQFQSLYSRVSNLLIFPLTSQTKPSEPVISDSCVLSTPPSPFIIQDHFFITPVSSPSSAIWNPYSISPLGQVESPQTPSMMGLPGVTHAMSRPVEARWREWIDEETCRRMHAASFVLDVHTSMYYDQASAHIYTNAYPPIPLMTSTHDLWTAQSPQSWEILRGSSRSSLEPAVLSEQLVTADRIASAHSLDRAVFLASEALRLRGVNGRTRAMDFTKKPDLTAVQRITDLFPESPVANTYLALHFTPLHALLAVSGDSWLFTKKIQDNKEFLRYKKQLKQWSNSLHAVVAAVYAAKALVLFLDHDGSDNSSASTPAREAKGKTPASVEDGLRSVDWNKSDISDWWALYVCALICWALCHNATTSMTRNSPKSGPSTSMSSKSAASESEETEALAWLRAVSSVAADLPAGEMIQDVRAKRQSMGVLAIVKRTLEDEAVGGKSKLLVDSVGVLRRLEEEGGRRWF